MTERNNENRFQVPTPEQPPQPTAPYPTPEVPNQTPQPDNKMSFSVPTEFVELPSGGKYYPQGHPLYGRSTIEIKYMTAKEEDILASPSLIKKGIVLDRLMESVMLNNVRPDDLLLTDKNAILIAIRATGYGSDYETKVVCPQCSEVSEHMYDLADLDYETPDISEYESLYNVHETQRGTFKITLENIDAVVEVKPLTGHDEKRLTSASKAKKRNNLGQSTVTDTMKAYIVSVNDNEERPFINHFVDSMPAIESRRLRTVYNKVMPNSSVKQLFSCANCGFEQELEVQINTDFFWPNE
tara:strand:+ start:2294 stop:3187 length:894 start_codon:yes stop_codon:yes gene_type:complete